MPVIHPSKPRITPFIAALAMVLSCGGGEDGVVNEMPGRSSGAPAPAPAPAEEVNTASTIPTPEPAVEVPEEEESQDGVRQLVFQDGSRDPFMRAYPQQEDPLTTGPTAFDIVNPVTPADDMGPLATFAIENLQLQGIMTRTANPVAMFRTPNGELSEFAYIGDRIGPNGAGYIEDIQPNQIVVVYETDPGGPTRRTVVPLRDATGGIEADFEQY